jgi:glycosylphosphatidylinositol transamidase
MKQTPCIICLLTRFLLDNTNGIASLLSLAKLFKRNVYWAKDVILLVTDHDMSGTQAWLDAYHGTVQNGNMV